MTEVSGSLGSFQDFAGHMPETPSDVVVREYTAALAQAWRENSESRANQTQVTEAFPQSETQHLDSTSMVGGLDENSIGHE